MIVLRSQRLAQFAKLERIGQWGWACCFVDIYFKPCLYELALILSK